MRLPSSLNLKFKMLYTLFRVIGMQPDFKFRRGKKQAPKMRVLKGVRGYAPPEERKSSSRKWYLPRFEGIYNQNKKFFKLQILEEIFASPAWFLVAPLAIGNFCDR